MIAVIDTAIDAAHPELAGAIAGIFDAVGEGPATAEPHGTEIAGILVARSRLGCGAGGQAPQRPCFSRQRRDPRSHDVSTAERNQLGLCHRRQSHEYELRRSEGSSARTHRQTSGGQKGVILIAAAGNNGPERGKPVYPAAYPRGDRGDRHRRTRPTLRPGQSWRLHFGSRRRASTLSRRCSRAATMSRRAHRWPRLMFRA